MSVNAGNVPYNYGDLLSITNGENGKVYFWFSGRDGAIRGLWIDTKDKEPHVMPGDREIVVKRGGANDTPTRSVVVKTTPTASALPPV